MCRFAVACFVLLARAGAACPCATRVRPHLTCPARFLSRDAEAAMTDIYITTARAYVPHLKSTPKGKVRYQRTYVPLAYVLLSHNPRRAAAGSEGRRVRDSGEGRREGCGRERGSRGRA